MTASAPPRLNQPLIRACLICARFIASSIRIFRGRQLREVDILPWRYPFRHFAYRKRGQRSDGDSEEEAIWSVWRTSSLSSGWRITTVKLTCFIRFVWGAGWRSASSFEQLALHAGYALRLAVLRVETGSRRTRAARWAIFCFCRRFFRKR